MGLEQQLQVGDAVVLAKVGGGVYRPARIAPGKSAPWDFVAGVSPAADAGLSFTPAGVLTVLKSADEKYVGFRSGHAEGKVLQATKEKVLTLRFTNHNFEAWEQWSVVGDSLAACTLVNRQFPDKKIEVSIQSVVALLNDALQASGATPSSSNGRAPDGALAKELEKERRTHAEAMAALQEELARARAGEGVPLAVPSKELDAALAKARAQGKADAFSGAQAAAEQAAFKVAEATTAKAVDAAKGEAARVVKAAEEKAAAAEAKLAALQKDSTKAATAGRKLAKSEAEAKAALASISELEAQVRELAQGKGDALARVELLERNLKKAETAVVGANTRAADAETRASSASTAVNGAAVAQLEARVLAAEGRAAEVEGRHEAALVKQRDAEGRAKALQVKIQQLEAQRVDAGVLAAAKEAAVAADARAVAAEAKAAKVEALLAEGGKESQKALKQTEEKAAALEKNRAQLVGQVDQLKKSLTAAEKKSEQTTSQVKALEAQLSAAESKAKNSGEAKKSKDAVKAEQERAVAAEGRAAAAEAAVKAAEARLAVAEAAVAEHREAVRAEQERAAAAEGRVKAAEAGAVAAEGRAKAAGVAAVAAEARAVAAEQKATDVRARKMDSKAAEDKQLREKVKAVEARSLEESQRLSHALKSLEASEARSGELEAQLQVSTQNHGALQNWATEVQAMLQGAQLENQQLRAELDASRQHAEQELQGLLSQQAAYVAEISELQRRLAEVLQERESEAAASGKPSFKDASLRGELEALRGVAGEAARWRAHAGEVEQKLREAEAREGAQTVVVATLERRAQSLDVHVQELQGQLAAAAEGEEDLAATIDDVTARVEVAEAVAQKAQAEASKIKAEKAGLEEKLRAMDTRVESLEEERNRLKKEAKELRKAAEAVPRELPAPVAAANGGETVAVPTEGVRQRAAAAVKGGATDGAAKAAPKGPKVQSGGVGGKKSKKEKHDEELTDDAALEAAISANKRRGKSGAKASATLVSAANVLIGVVSLAVGTTVGLYADGKFC